MVESLFFLFHLFTLKQKHTITLMAS